MSIILSITIKDIETLAGSNFWPPLPRDITVGINHNIKKAKREDVVFLPFKRPNKQINEYLKNKDHLDITALILDHRNPITDKYKNSKLVVQDAYSLYIKIAKLSRSRYEGELVMIIGSAGKTAIKMYLKQLISSTLTSNITADSKNQTKSICQSLSNLNEQVNLCIIEAATANPSSVEKRSDIIQPTLILATEILEEHMKYHSNLESLTRTKLKSLKYLQGDKIFIHKYQTNLHHVFKDEIKEANIIKVYSYGFSNKCDAYIKKIIRHNRGQAIIANIMGLELNFEIPFLEKFAALQVSACLLMCKIIGMNLNDIIRQTSKLVNFESSGNMYILERKIDKTKIFLYSSCDRGSFPSFVSLLDTISCANNSKGRKIGIFSKMIDQNYNGEYKFNNNTIIDLLNKAGLDLIITLWDFDKIHDIQKIRTKVLHYNTIGSLKDDIMLLLQNNDNIYMKATWTKKESIKTLRNFLFLKFESNSLIY